VLDVLRLRRTDWKIDWKCFLLGILWYRHGTFIIMYTAHMYLPSSMISVSDASLYEDNGPDGMASPCLMITQHQADHVTAKGLHPSVGSPSQYHQTHGVTLDRVHMG